MATPPPAATHLPSPELDCAAPLRRRAPPRLSRPKPTLLVSSSPRASPPPSATPTPPPTPLNLPPFTTSFDPLNMYASSSSAPAIPTGVVIPPGDDDVYFLGDLFAEPCDKGKGILGAGPAPVRDVRLIPKARDIHMVRPSSSASSTAAASSPTGSGASSSRSPPSPLSAPVALPGATTATGGAPNPPPPLAPRDAGAEVDSTEEESMESDDLDDGPEYVEVWVEEGDWEKASQTAFVYLEPLLGAANPTR
ncbi:WAS/WASL-interacting protein family member 1-like [Panicum virgatum]|uniref:WAS/WASL-interacting protein family member 1-like n=1 Tax=Panicum virgatum TaxID=38727 RepID=UPI0019D5E37E|nr:WAS/WASL-interacting protein family member 1-like [Panicum virgatum]